MTETVGHGMMTMAFCGYESLGRGKPKRKHATQLVISSA